MRQIFLDTETTGLDFRTGDRVIELACLEMVGRKMTRRHFHHYFNPDREISAGAQAIHGLTTEFLADKPRFADLATEFLDFIRDAELIIHNAPFDIGFLDNELSLLGLPPLKQVCSGVVDTLRMAREMRPGRKNSLDALCSEFDVDNSGRTLHGALLDTELLAEVYLGMTRGQESLLMELDEVPLQQAVFAATTGERARPLVLSPEEEELAAHERVLQEIAKESKGKCLWLVDTAPSP